MSPSLASGRKGTKHHRLVSAQFLMVCIECVSDSFSSENSRGAHSEVALNRDVSTMLHADVSVCAAAAFQPIKKTVGSKDEQIKRNLLEPEIEVIKTRLG